MLYDLIDDALVLYPAAKSGASYTVRSGVYSISAYAFRNAASPRLIDLSDTIRSIGEGAFAHCTALTELPQITSPYLTKIGRNAFRGCTGLNEITIPENITIIDDGAFNGCHNLVAIHIPANVQTIGTNAFVYGSIWGMEGTAAQRYAEDNDLPFFLEGASAAAAELRLGLDAAALRMGQTIQLGDDILAGAPNEVIVTAPGSAA